MPEMDIRRKYTHGHKRKKKKQKESLGVAIVSGLLPWKGDEAVDVVRKLVFLVSIFALTFATIRILDFYFGSYGDANANYWEADHENESTATITIGGGSNLGEGSEERQVEILERYREFYEKNPEFVGYLLIDPWINYPVAQSQGDTPYDFYLNHNFERIPTANGSIFADKFGEFSAPTSTSTGRPHNVILHGHNLRTRNLFQPLMNYRGSNNTNEGFEFLQNNPIITFDTLFEPGKYKIFSVYQTNINELHGEYFDYWRQNYFKTKDEFYTYVTDALDRSRYHTGVDLQYGDEILTLSTCDFSMFSDIRLVVVARRVRDNEAPVMSPETFINLRENNGRTAEGFMKYKMFDAYYRAWNHNNGWAGRHWDVSRVTGLDEWLRETER
jgi:sortase B